MAIITSSKSYGETFPPVVARASGMIAASGVDIPFTNYLQKLFPPGLFAGTNGVGFRFLPRTKFKSNAGAIVTVSPATAGLFFVGDALTIINTSDGSAGSALGIVASVNFADNQITLTSAPGTVPSLNTVIGVATSRPIAPNGNRLGIIQPNTAIQLDNVAPNPQAKNTHFACFVNGVYYRDLMPHLDAELERLYPEMNFV